MITDNYKVLNVAMPTFVQDIFRITGFVNMICNKANINSCDIETLTITDIRNNTTEESQFNLTGNPLEINLEEDGDSEILIKQVERPKNWTKEEENYYPLTMNASVSALNDLLGKQMYFCLCKDKSPRNTLLMGCQSANFQRYHVSFLGCYTLDQEQALFSTIKKRHLRNCMPYKTFEVKVCVLYPIFGYNKRKAQDVTNKDIDNSAFIETSGEEETYEWSEGITQKLFLQVNVNKSDSLLYPLYQHLNQINALIELLAYDDDIANAKIGLDLMSFQEVSDRISELMETGETAQISEKCKIENWAELNVEDMRNKNFLETLWSLLISLKSLEEVRECFHIIFQDLMDVTATFQVPVSNVTTIGEIIKRLKDGTMAVPTLTLQATLQYLIELGLNNLFHDYLFIVENMCDKFEPNFNDSWREIIQSANVPAPTKLNARKSRLSVCKGIENTGTLKKQLNYIAYMNLAIEFMQLVKICGFNSETMIQCYNQIVKCGSLKKSFNTLKDESIVDFECELNGRNDLIKKLLPVSINVRFSTEKRKGLIDTIFHFSDVPIFPDNVFKKYDVDITNTDEKMYYVHQAAYLVN